MKTPAEPSLRAHLSRRDQAIKRAGTEDGFSTGSGKGLQIWKAIDAVARVVPALPDQE
jgi:hypothetical protein